MADAVIQLRHLQVQHAELLAACRDKDAELQQLRDLVDAAGALQTQDVQVARIIELSKQNRTLGLALEKEKAKAGKLQSELRAAVNNKGKHGGSPDAAGGGGVGGAALPLERVHDIARSVVEQAAEAAEAAAREAATWRERCQQQTNKIAQLEQKVFNLEIEGKKLTRALVREVGDDVPLARVLDDGSDWKGRRELVVSLRAQLQALKTAQGLVPESKQEATARRGIAKAAGSRAAELDALRAELTATRADVDAARTKADAAISRRRVLENEVAGLKDNVGVLLRKSRNDDELIAALRAEVVALRARVSPERPPGGQLDQDELWRELGALRRQCGEHQAHIERYEAAIQSLKVQLGAAQAGSGAAQRSQRSSSGAPIGQNSSQNESAIELLGGTGRQASRTTGGGERSSQLLGTTQQHDSGLEVDRLKELVELQQARISQLEDELQDALG